MIKKIFNALLEIPFLFFIIVLTGVIAWDAMRLAAEYREADDAKAQIELDNYDTSERYQKINEALIGYLEEILEIYKVSGTNAVMIRYPAMSNELGYKLFDLVIADGNEVYDSAVPGKETFEDFEAAMDDAWWRYRNAPAEVRLEYDMRLSNVTKTSWHTLDIEDYFDLPIIDFLEHTNPEIMIRVCTNNSAVRYFYNDLEAKVAHKHKIIDDSLDNYVAKATDRLGIYAIAYGMLWLFEICKLRKKVKKNENSGRLEKFKTEIILLLGGIGGFVFANGIIEYVEEMPNVHLDEIKQLQMIITGILVVSSVVLYNMIAVFIMKIIRGTVFKDSLIVKGLKKAKATIQETYGIEKYGSSEDIKRMYLRKICMDVIVTIIVIYSIMLCEDIPGSTILYSGIFVAFLIFYVWHSIKEYKYIRLFNKVNKNIDYLYHGMYEAVERCDDGEIIEKLGNLSLGFERSVAKQIEAEKLQIELITNVSHDLKTPLTSIISYVDLLSKEELPPVATDYVKILVDKSDRLKSIVSDVFDLARATSGEEIQLENLDGMILVNQVLSDMDDAIKESGRDLKLKTNIETAPITANGQKLYRVFQNVIGNALKYSMPGTRIFINTTMVGNEFEFVIKNVSEFEIDYTEEEILSRFVRGDKARNSEGNGLGLSIAKSFTEQCGGRFEVKLDDDMFKVIIRLR